MPAIAGFPPVAPEPISPELVLVDPELRRALQARELERPALRVLPDEKAAVRAFEPEPEPPLTTPNLLTVEPLPAPAPTPLALPQPDVVAPGPPSAPARGWARLVPILLPLSLALNAILIAVIVSDMAGSQPSSAPPSLTTALPGGRPQQQPPPPGAAPRPTESPATKARKSTPPRKSRVSTAAPTAGARSVAVERKLLNLVIQSPSGKLPRALIDPKTGLAKNNLQAACRRESGGRSYLCVVQPAQHKPGEGAYVRYRRNRSGTGGKFTWYAYRNG